jgi:hypothetical protein
MQPVLAIRTTLSGLDNIWEHDPENGLHRRKGGDGLCGSALTVFPGA